MFDQLKRLLSMAMPATHASGFSVHDQVLLDSWLKSQGMVYRRGAGVHWSGKSRDLFQIEGWLRQRRWRIGCGLPDRDFIHGHEIRARTELGVLDSVAVVVMNRPLKSLLEKRAYSVYTDSLQTAVDPTLPEEMRWLAIYPEVGWMDAPEGFFDRYAVLAGKHEHASAWLKGRLEDALMRWPSSVSSAQVPFIMMLLRGRCYLRMQFTDMDVLTLQCAITSHLAACEAALDHIAQDLSAPAHGKAVRHPP